MTINFKIDEKDFLRHQLFIASKSNRIKKKRLRNKILVPLIYFVFGVMCFIEKNYFVMFLFFIFGLLWFLIYPIWEKRHYIKHYECFIKENFKERFDKNLILEFSDDFIVAKDDGSESRVSTKEIEDIVEIPSTIFVRLKGGQSFILPENKIVNIDDVKVRLKELAVYLDIKYNFEENWEWK